MKSYDEYYKQLKWFQTFKNNENAMALMGARKKNLSGRDWKEYLHPLYKNYIHYFNLDSNNITTMATLI